jgi:hypothetical protein
LHFSDFGKLAVQVHTLRPGINLGLVSFRIYRNQAGDEKEREKQV